MNRVYFKNASGQYHYGQFFDEVGDAVRFALEFQDIAPLIMVTNKNDCSIFEIENRAVIFPEDEDFSDVPKMGLCDHLPSSREEYVSLIERRNTTPIVDDTFQLLEATLLAAAARDNINLNEYGWSLPE